MAIGEEVSYVACPPPLLSQSTGKLAFIIQRVWTGKLAFIIQQFIEQLCTRNEIAPI
jgi:hypothetical protein